MTRQRGSSRPEVPQGLNRKDLEKMTPATRQVALDNWERWQEGEHSLLAHYHFLGSIAALVREGDDNVYGAGAVLQLAQAYRVDRSAINRAYKIFKRMPTLAHLESFGLSWEHHRRLIVIEDVTVWRKLAERAGRERWSTARLRSAIERYQESQAGAPAPRVIKPRHAYVMLERVRTLSGGLTTLLGADFAEALRVVEGMEHPDERARTLVKASREALEGLAVDCRNQIKRLEAVQRRLVRGARPGASAPLPAAAEAEGPAEGPAELHEPAVA